MWFLMGLLLLLLFLRMPVAFSIAISSLAYLLIFTDLRLVAVAQRISAGADSFILLAVPFFMFAGELMNAGGITRRLVRFANALVGNVRGGLSYVVIVVNMVMAGVSGAAIADAAAVGSVMIPSMKRNGYRPGFAAAVNAAAATIGPVIPPSVGFIIYASLANVSVGKLFLAGAAPGLIMGLYMMIVCYLVARRHDLPRGEPVHWRELWDSFRGASWALLMPIIILGGIVGGVVTPTEAGVIAVVYGMFVGKLVYGEISWGDIPHLMAKAAKSSALILFIIACSDLFGWLLTLEGAPAQLLATFSSISDQPWVFMLIILAMLLILGCVMEGASLMIILTPLLLPVLERYQIDLIHFGVVFQLAIMIGLLTPPIGMLLYVVTGVGDVSMQETLKELWPFLIALVIALLLIAFFPAITLWLPGLWVEQG
ncbi:TRAP transporter large permease [Pirellulales bacterium]|nr:TRAP transporter large permease [Pirellulales bacterium]